MEETKIAHSRGGFERIEPAGLVDCQHQRARNNWANTILPYRSPSGIPGRWPSVAHRCQPHPQALPHARLRSQRGRRQEQILVLLVSAEKGQEGKRRDRYPQQGTTYLKPIQCYLPEMGCSVWR